jgi:hypothetical protein
MRRERALPIYLELYSSPPGRNQRDVLERPRGVRIGPGAAALVAAALLTGCGGGDGGAKRTRTSPTRPSEGVLVTYHRTGGFAGFDDRVVVYADRRVVVTTRIEGRSEYELPVERYNALVDALEAADWSAGSRTGHAREGTVADAITHTIIYGSRSASLEDPGVPDGMQEALRELEGLVTGSAES